MYQQPYFSIDYQYQKYDNNNNNNNITIKK